ncbi:Tubulin-specific chaperone D [Trichinella patagoniensis]|uniref:Tubulin-specific chaperone D n=1 Tax=Trichinella patagoniensis TaxID=990121 RepID=A0A0V1ADA6_9BILA|nr:Tubulin-specific chaperone D [Trichinella patagoniensis]KRY22803.1 Tubulin-specific chaperone D [Trichinella patagoniensis]KRY22804.1 Tubulin-specific chaperone D [Trichinella patagoniensis]KRY22805.1 Tubulin-specific chaperone D [Trichinella patagoniensis]
MDDEEIDRDVANSVVLKDNFTELLVRIKSVVTDLPVEVERGDFYHLESCFERFGRLLDEFQVKPSLLDPVMVSVLPILIGYILDRSTSSTLRDESFKYAHQLVKVRGEKASLKHFPREVNLLKNVLLMLEEVSLGSRSRCTHEKASVLLLWSIVLSKVPFNLDNAKEMVSDEQFVGGYAQKIFDLALRWFHGRGREQLLAARLLAELVTRPDAIYRLPDVLKMAVDWLSTMKSNENSEKLSVAICWTEFLAACLKKASRRVMKKHARWLHDQLNALSDFDWKSQDVCMRKMWSKLSQRIALVILKPKLNDEQLYRRGMLNKLAKENDDDDDDDADDQLNKEKSPKVPKVVEQIAVRLVDMLHDPSCLVRWSAAKGVGRLAARLPSKHVSMLVDWILELGTNIAACADDIQGVCLALAELCRHGLIPTDKLGQVVSLAKQALKFDQIGCALSSSVRDSACYLCWTFGRSLTRKAMLPHAYHLAPHLIVVALFDREVTCRRAASAAFQENVGRHQLFPYGIEVLTAADYYSVSNLKRCYGEIALKVAEYGEYLRPIMECLIEKLSHWDEQIRVLAAGTLAALTPFDPCYIAVQVFPQLWNQYHKVHFFSKHGAVVALAKLTVSLYNEKHAFAYLLAGEQGFRNFQQRWKDEVMDIPKEISEAGLLLKTYGFSYMTAICDLIVEVSESGMPVENETLEFWFGFLKSHLTHADETIRQVSVKALRAAYHAYAESYFAANTHQLIQYPELLIGRLEKPNSEMDCVGAALELSCCSNLMFNLQQGQVVHALSDCFGYSRGSRRAWVKARQACLSAMFHVAVSFKLVGWKADVAQTTLFACDYLEVLRCHALAMEDLTRTVVGDVGMVVRKEALRNLCELVRHGARAEGMLLMRSDLMVLLTQNLLQQCLDVNHLQRKLACSVMVDMLKIEPPRPFLVNRDDLERAFLQETVEWISPAQAYRRLIGFLEMPAFQKHLLFAYVLAIGSESQTVAESALVSLIDYASSLPTISFYMSRLMENFLSLFHKYSHIGWLLLLLMKALQKILSTGIFPKHCEEVEDWQLSRLYFAVSKFWNDEKADAICKNDNKTITKSKLRMLRAVVDLCCEFMQYTKLQAASESRQTIVAFLSHPCLNVRRYAASRLYETLLCSDPDSSDEKNCQAMELLEQTDWCAPVEDLEPLCQKLNTLIEIDLTTTVDAS